ncbi:hypothetical protein GCM10017559_61490 [Streptosporangium longisporum]|uniref:EamA domain-containing protein n=1 Tax=Streptosporangium longisporum TaxID=46187 RepID=A0ABP6L0I0_9ACTN
MIEAALLQTLMRRVDPHRQELIVERSCDPPPRRNPLTPRAGRPGFFHARARAPELPQERPMNSNSELTGEPALWASLAASGVQLAAAFFLPWSDAHVAVVNALILALAGVWVALATKSIDNGGSIKAAILGAVQAALSLAITFGWEARPEQTGAIMTFVGLGVAVFIRQTSKPKNAFSLAA